VGHWEQLNAWLGTFGNREKEKGKNEVAQPEEPYFCRWYRSSVIKSDDKASFLDVSTCGL